MTIVYTSHYMEEVQAICDQLAIVDHGKVVLQSSLADLLDEQRKVLDLTLSAAPSGDQLDRLHHLGDCRIEGKRLKIYLGPAQTSLDHLLEQVRAAGLDPRQIQYGMNRLEDIYLSITKRDLRD
jgi:ABC-2 type transport system ATP-binding protein